MIVLHVGSVCRLEVLLAPLRIVDVNFVKFCHFFTKSGDVLSRFEKIGISSRSLGLLPDRCLRTQNASLMMKTDLN
jgi:hypothetical protein